MKILVVFLLIISAPSPGRAEYPKNCMSQKEHNCMSDFLSKYKGTLDHCRKVEEHLATECSRDAVVSCLWEEVDIEIRNKERNAFYNKLRNFWGKLCESRDNDKSNYDFFRYMVPDEYLVIADKCVHENRRYIVGCIEKTSHINMPDENLKICLRWDSLALCTKDRIGEKCGDELRGRFLEHFPDKPEHVKRACQAVQTLMAIDFRLQPPLGIQIDNSLQTAYSSLALASPLPPLPNCAVTEWSHWSPCSEPCGEGVKYRMRRFQSIETFYSCNMYIDIVQKIPCAFEGVDCALNLTETESSLDASSIQSVAVINTTGLSRPPPRKDNCIIRELERPVFQRVSTEEVGAWFQDAMPTKKTENKYYSTFASDNNHLYEYNSIEAFRSNSATEIYEVPFPFTGTGHLVYNGSFYYHEAKSQMLVRYEFHHENLISYANRISDVSYDDENYLYSSELGYMDVMVDENGLWVVYSAKDTNNTLVRKLHPYTLITEYIWNLTLPHRNVGEMFIACGVLYVVDSVTAQSTRIRIAFDLYQNKVLEVNIPFSNPYKSQSMIAYNPKQGKLFTWDKVNQFAYPIVWHY